MKIKLEILDSCYLYDKVEIEDLDTKRLVPKMLIRRRLTRASKIIVKLLDEINSKSGRIFYGTAYGELNSTANILNSIIEDGLLSPTDFQNSVYNTAISYFSILNNNTSEILTVSSGEETSMKLLKLGAIKALDEDTITVVCTETINIKNIEQVNKCIDYLECGVALKIKLIKDVEANIEYENMINKGFPKSINEMLTIAKAFDKDKQNIIEVNI